MERLLQGLNGVDTAE